MGFKKKEEPVTGGFPNDMVRQDVSKDLKDKTKELVEASRKRKADQDDEHLMRCDREAKERHALNYGKHNKLFLKRFRT